MDKEIKLKDVESAFADAFARPILNYLIEKNPSKEYNYSPHYTYP